MITLPHYTKTHTGIVKNLRQTLYSVDRYFWSMSIFILYDEYIAPQTKQIGGVSRVEKISLFIDSVHRDKNMCLVYDYVSGFNFRGTGVS